MTPTPAPLSRSKGVEFSPGRTAARVFRSVNSTVVRFSSKSRRAPSSRCQRPWRSMPMATRSYFPLSMALAIFRADTSEISCSADLPPNSNATRIFFFIANFRTGPRMEGRRLTLKNGGWRMESMFDRPSSILDFFVGLRLLRECRRSLLFDDLDDFAGVSLFFELQDEVLGFYRISFVVEFDGAGDTFEILDVAHRRDDIGTARFFARVGFDPSLYGFDPDQGRVIAVHAERFRLFSEPLLILFCEGCGFGIGIRRTSDTGVVASNHSTTGDLGHLRRIEHIRSHELRLDPFFAELLQQKSALVINAAEVDEIGILGLERNDHRREVGALFSAVKTQGGEAELLCLVAKIFRNTLAVEGLVVDDVNGLQLQVLGREPSADGPLDVVAAAHPIDIRVAAIGNLGRGIRRGNHRQHGVFVNFRRRKGDPGIEMSDDHEHLGIRDHISRVRNADLRFSLVVLRHKHQIVAEIFERFAGFFHSELSAKLDVLADGSLLAG